MSSDSSGGSSAAESVRQAFANLSVADKVSTLIRIELDMLGDTVECVVAAASKAVDEIANACRNDSGSTSSDAGQPAAN
ncbi:MAG TPA: hypothetical protein VLM38_03605 [Blastocatellia bacterium]|nr:hypothetical protein [Blastocatellia bacterium]